MNVHGRAIATVRTSAGDRLVMDDVPGQLRNWSEARKHGRQTMPLSSTARRMEGILGSKSRQSGVTTCPDESGATNLSRK
jgi:hypothetical protein